MFAIVFMVALMFVVVVLIGSVSKTEGKNVRTTRGPLAQNTLAIDQVTMEVKDIILLIPMHRKI